jgi:hypothetical protein
MQYDDEGKLHPVFYGSKCLGQSQLIWPSFCKEFYAAFIAITRLRYYLYGRKFTLYTDCQSMTFSKAMKKCTSNAVLRWAIELSSYTFDIKFIPGAKNVVSDTLSRLPTLTELEAVPKHSRELYDYFKGEVKKLFGGKNRSEPHEGGKKEDENASEDEEEEEQYDIVNVIDNALANPLSAVQVGDPRFLQAAKEDNVLITVRAWVEGGSKVKEPMKLEPSLRRYHNKFERLSVNKEGLLCVTYYNPQKKLAQKLVCVPEEMIEEIIRVHHEITSGHLAAEKTRSSILQKFYFPDMQERVRLFCQTCSQCFKTNLYYKKAETTKLKPVVYKYPGLCVAMDVVMVRKGSKNSKILTVTDKFTKWCGFFPIRDEKAKTIAMTFLEKWVSYWSVPEILITDNALSFKASEVMNNVYQLLAIDKHYCSPHHPEGNGESERMNKVLLHMLQKLVDEFPQKWKSLLPQLQLAVNGAQNRSTGFSAFKLMTGREMRGLENIIFDVRNTEYYQSEAHLVNETYKELRRVFQIASDNLELTHALQKKVYDRNRTHVKLETGDRVLLYRPKDTNNAYYKLKTHWQGPHVIMKVFDDHNYLIKEEGKEKEQVVHRNHLRKLPDGMRGNLADPKEATVTPKSSGKKMQDEGNDEKWNFSDSGGSNSDSDFEDSYYYPDGGMKGGDIRSKRKSEEAHDVTETGKGEIERTTDVHQFDRRGVKIPEHEGRANKNTKYEALDFWSVSEGSCPTTDQDSGRSTPEIREKNPRRKEFRKPRYTEFHEPKNFVGETLEGRSGSDMDNSLAKGDEEENPRLLESGRSELNEAKLSIEEENGPGSNLDTMEDLRGDGPRTPPAKDNFTRPQAASTPKPSALIDDIRRCDDRMQKILDKMKNDLEEEVRHKDTPAEGKEEAGVGVRRSARNKGKKKVEYYKEKNPEAP